jgi:hypothetical protein
MDNRPRCRGQTFCCSLPAKKSGSHVNKNTRQALFDDRTEKTNVKLAKRKVTIMERTIIKTNFRASAFLAALATQLTLLLLAITTSSAKLPPAGVAIVNGNTNPPPYSATSGLPSGPEDYGFTPWHQSPNWEYFKERAPVNWTTYLAGDHGPVFNYTGLGWNPFKGAEMIRRAATNKFAIVMHYGTGIEADPNASYYAAQNGTAVFCYHSAPNLRHYLDYGYWYGLWPGWVGYRGPMPAMIVSGGYSTSSIAVNAYGPQGEFIDGHIDNVWCLQSHAHAATAARYAKIRNLTGWTNVFDIRQSLRQTCTFYPDGWREDGGYGFPLVSNRVGNDFVEAQIITNLAGLDVGPPIQPRALISSDGRTVTFAWYNYGQTGFSNTFIKINGTTVFEGNINTSNCTWTSTVDGPAVADFYTKLTDGRVSRGPALEPYIRVPLNGLVSSAQACAVASNPTVTPTSCTIHVSGPVNTTWQVQESYDLVNWQLAGSVTLVSSSITTFTRTGLSGVTYLFLRVTSGDCCSSPVGFVRMNVAVGELRLIANQFVANQFELPAATLTELFAPMPDGTYLPNDVQISKWNGAAYDTYSWNATSKRWLPNGNATLSTGEAAMILNPSTNTNPVTITFAGMVKEGNLVNPLTSGNNFRSSMVPQGGLIHSVLGYNPAHGDNISKWTGSSFDTFIYAPFLIPGVDWYYNSASYPTNEPSVSVGEGIIIGNNSGANSWIRSFIVPCP